MHNPLAQPRPLNNTPYWILVVVLFFLNSTLFVLFFPGYSPSFKISLSLTGGSVCCVMTGIIFGALGALVPFKKLPFRKKYVRAGLISIMVYLIFYSIILLLIGIKKGLAI